MVGLLSLVPRIKGTALIKVLALGTSDIRHIVRQLQQGEQALKAQLHAALTLCKEIIHNLLSIGKTGEPWASQSSPAQGAEES